MASTNPISVGYAAIWSAINNWHQLAVLVKSGLQTQINYQAPGFQPTTNVQAGDRPSIRLVEGRRMSLPYQRNSKAVQIDAAYPLEIRTGSFLVDNVNLLETLLDQAFINADGNSPGTLGVGIINKYAFDPSDLRQRDMQTKRPEWVVAVTIKLTFMILRSEYLSTVYT